MRRRTTLASVAALIGASLLATCQRPVSPAAPPAREFGTTVAVASGDVEFGVAFPLTVTQIVRSGAPMPADPSLAPLVTRLEATTTGSGGDAQVVLETRFRAWAFTLGDVDVSGARLHVRSSLPADDDGRPELPEELLAVPRSRRAAWIAALVAGSAALGAAALALWMRRRRRRNDGTTAAAERPPAGARALARLQRLRAKPLDVAALHDEASALLRDYVEERFEPRAPSRTSEELIGDETLARALGAAPRARLVAVLPALDRVRFGRSAVAPAAALRLLDELEAFVGETSP
jgi:hypothetical protein